MNFLLTMLSFLFYEVNTLANCCFSVCENYVNKSHELSMFINCGGKMKQLHAYCVVNVHHIPDDSLSLTAKP